MSNLVELGAVAIIALALLKIIERLIRQQAAREIATREAEQEFRKVIVATQDRIASVLENHLSEISEHMAVQTELSRAILAQTRRE